MAGGSTSRTTPGRKESGTRRERDIGRGTATADGDGEKARFLAAPDEPDYATTNWFQMPATRNHRA